MKKLSIVVNGYNAGNYIEKCLRSILDQNLHNEFDLEIIVSYSQEFDNDIEPIITKLNNPKIKKVPVLGTRFIYQDFLHVGYEMISKDSTYIYFLPGESYFLGKELLYTALKQIKENEEIVIFKNSFIDSRGKIFSLRKLSYCHEYILSSIIFLNREDIISLLASYFSYKYADRTSENYLEVTMQLAKRIEDLNPIVIDTTTENALVIIKPNKGWLYEIIKYYILKNPNNNELEESSELLLALGIDNFKITQLFDKYMKHKIDITELKDTIGSNKILSKFDQKLLNSLFVNTISFEISEDL